MKKSIIILSIVFIFLFVTFSCLKLTHNIGITKKSIQEDARYHQKIPDHWNVSMYTTKQLSAMIFYDENQTNHIFSIYVNRDGLSYGYFFRLGGKDSAISNSVKEIQFEDSNERVYISMNSKHASLVQIENETSIEIKQIDPNNPFVFIVADTLKVIFMDANGKVLYK